MDATNQETNSSSFTNFEFEVDQELKKSFRDIKKIFGSDPTSIRRIAKQSLIFGVVIAIISVKALISFVGGFRIDLLTFVFALGAFLIYTSFYLKRNISKFPVIIVYEDKILFKEQKYFGRLTILSLIHFFYSNGYKSIDRRDIKNVLVPAAFSGRGELIIQSYIPNSDVYAMLNVSKEYRDHIALYLQDYAKSYRM
jgi:hypothetical protein